MEAEGNRYSSSVRLRLEGAGQVIRLAQVAPDWVIPAEPMNLPACDVDVVVWVDGEEDVRHMHLPHGRSASGEKVRVTSIVG
jgi:hypothetical protein